MKKYYKLLEISEDASSEEIKKAFKKLAIKYHPDRHNNSDKKAEMEEKFKDVQEAYSVLSDPDKKRNYDLYDNVDGPKVRAGNPYAAGFEDIFSNMGFDPFADLRHTRKRTKGANLRVILNLSFNESITGKELDIEVTRREKCKDCSGTGSKDGKTTTCSTCHGSGFVGQGGGFFQIKMPCPTCKGSGQLPIDKCPTCKGAKYLITNRKIHIRIKPGVSNGEKLILRGQGHQDGDIPGDIYIMLNISKHEYFNRKGNDIMVDIPISFTQAVFGDKIEIPTINGKVKLSIPEGSESGKVLKLKQAGINGGNMYVRVNVNIPKKTDPKIKKILENLEQAMPSTKAPKPKRNK